jgi:hypothetical protein
LCATHTQVGSCLGSFLKSFGDAALPYVEGLMPSIAPLLDKARPDEERRIAMCIIDDMLEHSAQGRAKYLAQVCVGVCLGLEAGIRAHMHARKYVGSGVGSVLLALLVCPAHTSVSSTESMPGLLSSRITLDGTCVHSGL